MSLILILLLAWAPSPRMFHPGTHAPHEPQIRRRDGPTAGCSDGDCITAGPPRFGPPH